MSVSKPRYDWWPYIKGMIRRYPDLREQQWDLQRQSLTANYTGIKGVSGGTARPVEQCILAGLTGVAKRECEAVALALEQTEDMPNHLGRLMLIRLTFWQGFTLQTAALQMPCSIATAKRWHGDFIRLVAKNFGLLED